MISTGHLLRALLLVALTLGLASAQPMMMDPSKMSGIPRPDPQVPAATITVRLIRGQLANKLTGVDVDLVNLAGGDPRRAQTDGEGRATFSGLPLGTYEARAAVDGNALASQPIELPASPGVRVMLVFPLSAEDEKKQLGAPDGTARVDDSLPAGTLVVKALDDAGQPVADLLVALHHASREKAASQQVDQLPERKTDAQGLARWDHLATGLGDGYLAGVVRGGAVARSKPFGLMGEHGKLVVLTAHAVVNDTSQLQLGNGSHIIVEVSDDSLQVIENLILKNPGEQTVDPGPAGVRIPLSEHALSAQIIGGEQNPRLAVDVSQADKAPTVVWHGPVPPGNNEVRAGFLLKHDGAAHFHQEISLGVEGLLVVIAKLPTLQVSAPGLETQERRVEGKDWIFVRSQLKAGQVLEFHISGLPYDGPRNRALAAGVALLIAVVFLLVAWRGAAVVIPPSRRSRRQALEQRREALLSEMLQAEKGQGARARETVMAELEAVYRELDQLGPV